MAPRSRGGRARSAHEDRRLALLTLLPDRLRLQYALAAAMVHAALASGDAAERLGGRRELLAKAELEELRLLQLSRELFRALSIAGLEDPDTHAELDRMDASTRDVLSVALSRSPAEGLVDDGWLELVQDHGLIARWSPAGRERVAALVRDSLFAATLVLWCGTSLELRSLQGARTDDGGTPRLLQLVELDVGPTVSYRVHYNRACFWASTLSGLQDVTDVPIRVRSRARSRAYQELEAAVATDSPQRRPGLIRWAHEDPSLANLRNDPEFARRLHELAERYGRAAEAT